MRFLACLEDMTHHQNHIYSFGNHENILFDQIHDLFLVQSLSCGAVCESFYVNVVSFISALLFLRVLQSCKKFYVTINLLAC